MQVNQGGRILGSGKFEIKVGRSLYDVKESLFFHEEYYPTDANGNRYINPGLIVARSIVTDDQTGATYKYVPYNSGASYGTGSDTAYGVLDVRLNATDEAEAIAPLYHGQLQERNCYVLGVAKGTISATIKSHLPDVDWV